MSPVIEVPAVVRNKALAVGAGRWLNQLPELVASLEHDRGITVSRPYRDATEAFVAEARRPAMTVRQWCSSC
jgi:streptomycin 6-kinase